MVVVSSCPRFLSAERARVEADHFSFFAFLVFMCERREGHLRIIAIPGANVGAEFDFDLVAIYWGEV